MAAGNNDLSQSIALITTANTVAQDPTTVGQGIKTVSLRLRSTKTELEELGEDAEGAAENVSKLREQMLGLTGVDIQLDDTTYKSTYQILLEISKVWGDLDDLSRSSVLEQLFGKRQANIGAAILENGQLLEQVYKSAEDSAGSAMREQEEYSKSIQYSIDILKAAYQDFAQAVIKSDFVKTILSTGQTLLETITKIVYKVGLLPPLLASVATAMAFKNKGIFGTVKSDAEGANRQITLFGKTFSQIKEDIQTSDTKGLAKVKTAISSIGLQAKVTQAAVVAMNAALNIGISLAVSAAVSAISKWVNKEKEAKEQAEALKKEMEERRDAAYESISIYNGEKKAINSLIGEYVKLVATTDDISTIKDDLLSIQDQIVDKYGREAEAIDLVNNSLRENLNLLAQKDEEANRSWKTENYEAIEEAKSFFDDSGALDALSIFSIDWEDYYEGSAAKQEAEAYVSALKNALEEAGVSDLFDFSEYVKANESNLAESYRYSVNFASGLTREQVQTAAEEYAKAYEKVVEDQAHWQDYFNLAGDRYKYVLNYLDDISKRTNILDRLDESDLNQEIWDALKRNTEDYDNYLNLVSKATELTAKLNSPETTLGEKNSLALELDTVKSSLIDLGDKYPVVANAISQEIKGLGLDLTTFTDTVDSAKESWLESLDAAQKGVITDVDKIIAAMKKLYSGEAIDQKSAWDIINLDTEGILSNITIDQNGNYIFQLDQIVALKDSLIGKEIDLRNESIATAKQNLANAKMELEAEELRFEVVSMQLAAAKAPGSMAKNVSALEEEYNNLKRSIETNKKAVDSYNLSITNESLLTEQLQKRMGDLSDTLEMLTAQQTKLKNEIDALNKEADARLKAQEAKIDSIIDGYQAEVDELEEAKDLLQEQLDTLNEQKDALQEIVDNYESIGGIVENTISKQVEELEKSRQEVEDYYNNLIDKLKQENDEREDALNYAQKLADLENAKNNKVMVYGSGTGWTYEVDQDALAKAQRALDEADNDKAIKELERARDAAVGDYDSQIKAYEEYGDKWTDVSKAIKEGDEEVLAEEILGAEWREKITGQDIELLEKYEKEYRDYNNQLKTLTKTEIKSLEDSIKAKNKEIETKQKQVKLWKDYKSAVQDAVSNIKNQLEDYNEFLDGVALKEDSTYDERQKNLTDFANAYQSLITQIVTKNKDLDAVVSKADEVSNQLAEIAHTTLSISVDTDDASKAMADFIDKYREAIEDMQEALDESLTGFGVVNSAWDAKLVDAARALRTGSYAEGGAIPYTGIAMVHGKRNSSETAFSAAQSKELWNMVRTGNFTSMVADRAIAGVNKALGTSGATSNSRVINIGEMTIKADNPQQFHSQFMHEINKYWDVQVTSSPIQ